MIRGLMRGIFKLIKLIIDVTVTLALIAGCIYVDARYIEPRLLKEEKLELVTSKIKLKEPLKIVQFSDTHLGEYYTLDDLQKAVNKINSMKPDIIIFTGDLIDDNKIFDDEKGTIEVLTQLESVYGKYSIYGNHDHGSNGTRRYARIMKESGFTLLRNQHVEITLKDQSVISLIGIDDIVLAKPDFAQAFKDVPKNAYRVFLSHAPDVADKVSSYDVSLQLSGHTHGGQVRIPLLGAPLSPPYGKKYIKGLYDIEGSSMQLYVSSGIGTSQMPFRFLNIPEVAMITLKNP